MNPHDPDDLKRLRDAMSFSRNKLRAFREDRLDAIKQYVGKYYGENGADEEVPVNYYELAVTIYMQQLVGGAPRASVSPLEQNLKPHATDLKIALDRTAERIGLESTLWRTAQDALFGAGIVKIGMNEPGGEAWWSEIGEPFVIWVDLDDWVMDMTAKTWEAMAFCGNRYRVPLSTVRESEQFDKKVRENLKPTRKSSTTPEGDEKASTIGGGLDAEIDEYEDEVELWDIWLPREGLVITLSADDENSRPLRVVKWTGPRNGPYRMLGYSLVPSNIMPLPPVAIWKDLHDLGNELYLKLGRQALRQKSILPFRGGSDEDAEAIRESSDGDILRVDGEVPQEVSYGGPQQVNLAMFLGVNELVNRHFGNLDSLGGLSPTAETLGQEEMLSQNANQRIIFMRRRVDCFVDGILTDLAHYLYNDPLVSMPLTKRVPRTSVEVPFTWTPDSRRGNPSLYRISIEPYSLQYRNPQVQVGRVLSHIQNLILPVLPVLEAQGIGVNFDALLKMIAEKEDLPELADVLFFQEPSGLPMAEGAGQPAVTTRNYNRRSIPGAGRSQKENALAQALLGSMPQPAEAATITRGM